MIPDIKKRIRIDMPRKSLLEILFEKRWFLLAECILFPYYVLQMCRLIQIHIR